MNFTAIDFETANGQRASACSLALVIVRKNQIVDELYSLINPQTKFFWQNIKIHGLHASDVKDAPTFPELWPPIKSLFRPDQLVTAHNAAFDNGVLSQTLSRYHIQQPRYLTIDTLKTSRKFYPQLSRYRLNNVCDYLKISLQHHHNALSDSVACAQILIKEDRQFGDSLIRPFVQIIN